jgi:hypothetical protein
MLNRSQNFPLEPTLVSTDDGVHTLVLVYASKRVPLPKLLELDYIKKELLNSGHKRGTIKALTLVDSYLGKRGYNDDINRQAIMMENTTFVLEYTEVGAGIMFHKEWTKEQLCSETTVHPTL